MTNDLKQELKPLIRKLASIEIKQDLLDKERDILEDILLRVSQIEDRLKIVEDNQKRDTKDIKTNVADVGEQVIASLDNLTTEIDNTPTKKYSFFGKIKLLFRKKGGK